MADENGNGSLKETFKLHDGREVTLDMYRLTAKDIRGWNRNADGSVPNELVVKAIAKALDMPIDDVDALPIPDFLPISARFAELIQGITAPN